MDKPNCQSCKTNLFVFLKKQQYIPLWNNRKKLPANAYCVCREAVNEGVTGLLCTVRGADSLYEQMKKWPSCPGRNGSI